MANHEPSTGGRARPVSSPECLEAYDLDPQFQTLSLSDTHSRVMKRGRKSGRAGEYTYSFGKSLSFIQYLLPSHCQLISSASICVNFGWAQDRRTALAPGTDNVFVRGEYRPTSRQMYGRFQFDDIRLRADRLRYVNSTKPGPREARLPVLDEPVLIPRTIYAGSNRKDAYDERDAGRYRGDPSGD